MQKHVEIKTFLGMDKKQASTSLDPNPETKVVIPRELVNIDASKLPRLVPRPAFKPVAEGTDLKLVFPIFK